MNIGSSQEYAWARLDLMWTERSEDQPRVRTISCSKSSAALATKQLRIRASVIECKMGNRSQNRIEQGEAQLSEGIRSLQEIWNPQRGVHRPAVLVLPVVPGASVLASEHGRERSHVREFNKQLQEILDGKFSIEWRGLLLTYWLDSSSGEVATRELRLEGCDDVPGEHHTIGQFLIEKMLVAGAVRNLICAR